MNEQRTYEAPGVTRRSTVDGTLIGHAGSVVPCAVFDPKAPGS